MATRRVRQEGFFVEFDPPLDEFVARLKTFGPRLSSKYLASALKKAAEPARDALKANVQKLGKITGNLRRAIKIKDKKYTRTGNAVVLVGFAAVPGKRVPEGGDSQSAFHGGLIEFGTKERFTKRGSIASSFRSKSAKRANFEIIPPKVKKNRQTRMFAPAKTKPKYPVAFFARAPKGDRVSLGRTRVYAPIKRAWEQSRSRCEGLLTLELETAIQNAAKDIFATS